MRLGLFWEISRIREFFEPLKLISERNTLQIGMAIIVTKPWLKAVLGIVQEGGHLFNLAS